MPSTNNNQNLSSFSVTSTVTMRPTPSTGTRASRLRQQQQVNVNHSGVGNNLFTRTPTIGLKSVSGSGRQAVVISPPVASGYSASAATTTTSSKANRIDMIAKNASAGYSSNSTSSSGEDGKTSINNNWVSHLTASLALCMKTLSSSTIQLTVRRAAVTRLLSSLETAKSAIEKSTLVANHSDVVVALENIIPILNYQILKVGVLSSSSPSTKTLTSTVIVTNANPETGAYVSDNSSFAAVVSTQPSGVSSRTNTPPRKIASPIRNRNGNNNESTTSLSLIHDDVSATSKNNTSATSLELNHHQHHQNNTSISIITTTISAPAGATVTDESATQHITVNGAKFVRQKPDYFAKPKNVSASHSFASDATSSGSSISSSFATQQQQQLHLKSGVASSSSVVLASTTTSCIQERQVREDFLFSCCSCLKLIIEMLGPLVSLKSSVAIATTLVDALLLVFGLPSHNQQQESIFNNPIEHNHQQQHGNVDFAFLDDDDDFFRRPISKWEAKATECLAAAARNLEMPVKLLPCILAHFMRAVEYVLFVLFERTKRKHAQTRATRSNLSFSSASSSSSFLTHHQSSNVKLSFKRNNDWTIDRRFQFVAELVLTLLEDGASKKSEDTPSTKIIERAYGIFPSRGMRLATPFVIPCDLMMMMMNNNNNNNENTVEIHLKRYLASRTGLHCASLDEVVIATLSQLVFGGSSSDGQHHDQQQQHQHRADVLMDDHQASDQDRIQKRHLQRHYSQNERHEEEDRLLLRSKKENVSTSRNPSSRVSMASETTFGGEDGDEEEEQNQQQQHRNRSRSTRHSSLSHENDNEREHHSQDEEPHHHQHHQHVSFDFHQKKQEEYEEQDHQQQQQRKIYSHVLETLDWYHLPLHDYFHQERATSSQQQQSAFFLPRRSPSIQHNQNREGTTRSSNGRDVSQNQQQHQHHRHSSYYQQIDGLSQLWQFFCYLTASSTSFDGDEEPTTITQSQASTTKMTMMANPSVSFLNAQSSSSSSTTTTSVKSSNVANHISNASSNIVVTELQVRALALLYAFYPDDIGSYLLVDHWRDTNMATKTRIIGQLCRNPPFPLLIAHSSLMTHELWNKLAALNSENAMRSRRHLHEENGEYEEADYDDEENIVVAVVGSLTLVPLEK